MPSSLRFSTFKIYVNTLAAILCKLVTMTTPTINRLSIVSQWLPIQTKKWPSVPEMEVLYLLNNINPYRKRYESLHPSPSFLVQFALKFQNVVYVITSEYWSLHHQAASRVCCSPLCCSIGYSTLKVTLSCPITSYNVMGLRAFTLLCQFANVPSWRLVLCEHK